VAALAENQEAVVAQQLAERRPEIVEACAQAFGKIDHVVVLNGADGMSDMLTEVLSLGGTGLGPDRPPTNAMGAGSASSATPEQALTSGDLSPSE
jgi:flotillin